MFSFDGFRTKTCPVSGQNRPMLSKIARSWSTRIFTRTERIRPAIISNLVRCEMILRCLCITKKPSRIKKKLSHCTNNNITHRFQILQWISTFLVNILHINNSNMTPSSQLILMTGQHKKVTIFLAMWGLKSILGTQFCYKKIIQLF